MATKLPAIQFRPDPVVRERLARAVAERGYRSTGAAVNDAIRNHFAPVYEVPMGNPKRVGRDK